MKRLAVLVLLAASLDAAANDLYGAINRVRAGQGECKPAAGLAPLTPLPALERAARELSRGGELQRTLKDSGYRATRSRLISLKGDGIGARAAAILARQTYCRQLQEASLTDVGVFQDPQEIWIVLAAPLRVAMSGEAAGQRILSLVNHHRSSSRRCGDRTFDPAPAVRWNNTLALAARLHADDMARHSYFSHTGRDGSNPAQRVERAGYRYRSTGENIAAGQTTPEDAVASWLKSPGHCANLMNPTYTEMGAAFAFDAKSDMGVYWTQAFGTPR